jgi:hypothetical protein
MIKSIFIFVAAAIVAILLPIAGTGVATLFDTVQAQILGEPFFKETGKITGQKEIDLNRMQVSFSANGTLKDEINVTNRGEFVSISRGDNLTFGQGQGILEIPDGTETARYDFIGVGNVTQEGKPVFVGAAAYHTNSTKDLVFLNNVLGAFKVEFDETGSFTGTEWQWK